MRSTTTRDTGISSFAVGVLFVLPVLSATDLVLLFLMGIAHARHRIYSWAAIFVAKPSGLTLYRIAHDQSLAGMAGMRPR